MTERKNLKFVSGASKGDVNLKNCIIEKLWVRTFGDPVRVSIDGKPVHVPHNSELPPTLLQGVKVGEKVSFDALGSGNTFTWVLVVDVAS